MNRRSILKMLAAGPVAGGIHLNSSVAERAHRHARQASRSGAQGDAFQPQFFTPEEYRTVRILVDLILPADDRSPSASQVGVPQFMDFIMIDMPHRQTGMRGGLAALDYESRRRFAHVFAECEPEQRTALLDDVAFPDKAPARLRHLAAFFSDFRDLTASGFWTSKEGMEDLQYLGNTFVDEWTGCPDDVVKELKESQQRAQE